MIERFHNDRIVLYAGSCLDVLPTLEESSIDACVTDPPYHLTSIVKRFGAENAAPAKSGKTGAYARQSKGFMGKTWDGGEVAFEPETWAAVMRVLKPGGHLLAFGAPKNFGFMQYAIAQAGFEMRDVLAWIFGSGFPKSHNIGGGWGTALKPAYEPVIMARKPLVGTVARNIELHGTGAINIDGCRVESDTPVQKGAGSTGFSAGRDDNYEKGTGRIYGSEGRWPANVIHDGSEEVVGAFPDSIARPADDAVNGKGSGSGDLIQSSVYGAGRLSAARTGYRDAEASAARFFYSAKADADDRIGSKHPTVKPVDLMQWLVRLVTPKGGTVLDPFAGTGTTGEAAWREGFNAVLIEREEEYRADIRRRMALCLAGPNERARESIKARNADKPMDAGPLFQDAAE